MKKLHSIILFITLGILINFQSFAQVPDLAWVVQAGGQDTIWGYSISVDPSGNQVIAGLYRGTFDITLANGSSSQLTSNGLDDIFIMKLNSSGQFLWAISMGDVSNDRASAVTTDIYGNIYVTGYFSGTINANPQGDPVWLSQTKNTAFVVKYSPAGLVTWAKQMGFPGDWGLAYGNAIALDNNQNVITGGTFTGRVDFDPGPGTYNLSSNSYQDAFIQKLDNNGNFIWAVMIDGAGTEYIADLDVDASGNIYTTGTFTGTADFNPDKKAKFYLTSFGSGDVFYLKLNAAGNFAWAKQVGGTEHDCGYVVHVDDAGYLYGTGQFYGTGDYNPGSGIYSMTPVGMFNLFVEKLDLEGNFVWAKQVSCSGLGTSGHDIITDTEGNIYMTGFFYGTADFDMNTTSTFYLTANGADDIFISKYESDGDLIWAIQAGGAEHDWGFEMALDASGNIYTTGNFDLVTDFDPDGNVEVELTNTGDHDLFVQKLLPSGGNACMVPSGLQATGITETSAILGWTAVDGAQGYEIRYRILGSEDWTAITGVITSNSYPLTGLTEMTYYEFQVRTTCFSNFSYSYEFATDGAGCEDNYEPNETMSAAAAIPLNTDIFALISSASDVDWFKFTTTGGGKNLKITLTNLPADYNIKLYNGNGALLGSSQNTGTASEMILYNTNKVGTYYIFVSGYYGAYDPFVCYTLHVETSTIAFKSTESPAPVAELGEGFSIYPNPAREFLNIEYDSEIDASSEIMLTNICGQAILTRAYRLNAGQNHIIIPLDGLPEGIYLVRINTRDETLISKVMINR